MSLTLQRDLDRRNVAFDHDFIFKSRSLDFGALITRYRGTSCTPAQHGTIVTAWQKSIYRFGGFPLEETLVVTILVKHDGIVHGVSLDSRSHGGLGPLCDFTKLQQCLARTLRGRRFADFSRVCPTAGDVQCLHLFEVLSSASSFYSNLKNQELTRGTEEELLHIRPKRGNVVIESRHWVLGRELASTYTLRPFKKIRTSSTGLPESLSATLTMACGEGEVLSEIVEADDFRAVYTTLNRAFAKCSRLEKEYFDVKGKMRFTNLTALVGLLLMTMAHESMHVLRAIRIAWLLPVLQASGERSSCIAFCALRETYK